MKNHIFIGIIIFSISSSFLASCGKSDRNETSKTEQSKLKETSEIIPVLTEIDSTAEKAKTIDNLQAAYKGEVIAKAKYMAYAQKAEQEGFPQIASLYLKKSECFCFRNQVLKPGESKKLTVRFEVDKDIPKNVESLTLSYTFFRALKDDKKAS